MSTPDRASFDHLVHWVGDLDAAMSAYADAGLEVHAALTMPGFRNGAWGVDDERYVELAVVDDWDAVADSPFAHGLQVLRPAVRALDGPGLLTFAVHVTDARAAADRLRAGGREVEVVEVQVGPARFVEVMLRDAPAWWPFLITYDPPRHELARMRAEHRATHGVVRPDERPDLVALLARSPDPEGEARALGDLLEVPVSGATVLLPGAEVRLSGGDRSELHGLAVRGLSGLPFELAGTTVHPEA